MSQTFVFWLNGWHNVYAAGGVVSRCRITDDTFFLDLPASVDQSAQTWVISLHQIVKCEPYKLVSEHFSAETTRLVFDKITITVHSWSRKELYLIVAEPIWGEHTKEEAKCLAAVINSKRDKAAIDLHPNPYYRAFQRRNRLHEFNQDEWNAMIAPQSYRGHPIAKEAERNQKLNNLQVVSLILLAIMVLGTTVLSVLFIKNLINEALALSVMLAPVIGSFLYVTLRMRKVEADK